MSLQETYFALSIALFIIGLLVVITRRNIILVLMGVELMLNAANLNFVAFGRSELSQLDGQMMTMFVIVLAVAEAAVGLAILIKVVEAFKTSDLDNINKLKG